MVLHKEDSSSLLLIAHRGDPTVRAENTIPSFASAVKAGADILELDVRQTKDKALVVLHDATLERTTLSSGVVADFSYASLQKVAVREPQNLSGEKTRNVIPLLSEVLAAFKTQRFNIDLKALCIDQVAHVCDMASRICSADQIVLTSASSLIQRQLERVGWPQTQQGMGKADVLRVLRYAILGRQGPKDLHGRICQMPLVHRLLGINYPVVSDRLIHFLAAMKCPLHVWHGPHDAMVDDPSVARRLSQRGIQGIFTDRIGHMSASLR